jgi:hypothetical protein
LILKNKYKSWMWVLHEVFFYYFFLFQCDIFSCWILFTSSEKWISWRRMFWSTCKWTKQMLSDFKHRYTETKFSNTRALKLSFQKPVHWNYIFKYWYTEYLYTEIKFLNTDTLTKFPNTSTLKLSFQMPVHWK